MKQLEFSYVAVVNVKLHNHFGSLLKSLHTAAKCQSFHP